MGTNETRLSKVKWLDEAIFRAASKNRVILKDKLIAEFCLQFGSTRRTALEILKNMQITGRIKIKDNEIFMRKK